MSAGSQIDYDALAAQHGGTAAVDYDALAAQHGGTPSAQKSDTGVFASLKRTGSNLVHLPGAVYDAFAKPASPEEDISAELLSRSHGIPKTAALALNRLVVAPMAQKAQAADEAQKQYNAMTPEQQAADRQNSTGLYHTMTTNRIASMVPLVGPMAEDITHRYLTGDKSGAITDVATAVAGPKIAEGAVQGVARVASKAAPAIAERMYTSALKPSTTIPIEQRASIVRTGLESEIPISQAGAEKLTGLIKDLNDQVQGKIQGGAKAGSTIDPQAVATRADALKAKFANQVNPNSDIASIESAKQEFLANQPNNIPVDQAQALKVGTYQQLKGKAYGELKSGTIEAQKALARGIKEELETQFPEIKGLNAQEAKFYNLDGVLERALNRIGNHQLIGIGTPITMTAAGTTAGMLTGSLEHGAGVAAAAGILKAVLDNPTVKSRLAITLSKGGKLSPSVANARVNQFVNALAQSQGAAGTSAGGTNQ